MGKILLVGLAVLAAFQAKAETCSFQSPHPSGCGNGRMRMTIERGIMDNPPMFLLYVGDVGCWFAPFGIGGNLKKIAQDEYLLLEAGEKDVGRIQMRTGAASLKVNTGFHLQQQNYELTCE